MSYVADADRYQLEIEDIREKCKKQEEVTGRRRGQD